jgi:hypothetical protein
VPSEILYCTRCHRLLLPREVEDGNYHFVDGDPVCRECFTRLSRRLRPVNMQQEDAGAPPPPVDMTALEREMSKGASQVRAEPPEGDLAAPDIPAVHGMIQKAFMLVMFLLGLSLGGLLYAWAPLDSTPPDVSPPDPPASDSRARPVPDTAPASNRQTDTPPDNRQQPPPAEPVSVRARVVRPVQQPDGTWLLPAEADAYVSSVERDRNFGTEQGLLIRRDDKTVTHRFFLRFDASSLQIKPGSARLVMTMLKLSGIQLHKSRWQAIHMVSDNGWEEGRITWGNQPAIGAEVHKFFLTMSATKADTQIPDTLIAALRAGGKVSLCVTLAASPISEPFNFGYASMEMGEDLGPALLIVPAAEPAPSDTPADVPAEGAGPRTGTEEENPAPDPPPPPPDTKIPETADQPEPPPAAAPQPRT